MDYRSYVLDRHGELKAIRAPEEKIWKSIAECLRPEDQDFAGGNTNSSAMDEVFDSTPLYALEDFVGGLFGQATNPATRWFETGVPDEDLLKFHPVKEYFWSVNGIIGKTLTSSFSRFYEEAPAWFADLGAFGIGAFYSEEDIGAQRFIDRAIPLRETFIDVDHRGEVDTFHREFTLNGRQLKQKFGDLPDAKDTQDYTIIHAVFPNANRVQGRMGYAGMPWVSVYVSPDLKSLYRAGGYHEMPYFVPMWVRRSGKVYPRGPGHLARPDIRTLNEMERNHLTAAAFAADPMKLTHADADFVSADFYPGALLPGGMSDNSKKLVEYLSPMGSVQISMAQAEQRRQSIRDAFYFSVMQLMDRPQMTATEFNGFQEEKLRQLAPNLERIQGGGLGPLIGRRYAMLARAGQLPPPPPELKNQPLIINYTSPLAKLQKSAVGRSTLNWIGAVGQLAQVNPEVVDWVDTDNVPGVLHDAFGPPPAVMRDPVKVEEMRRQRAEAQQQQMALQQAQQQVEIAAGASHAMQAATLAKGRNAA